MPTVMQEYTTEVEAACADNECYQVKQIGGAFMIVAADAQSILTCSVQLSKKLERKDWYKIVNATSSSGADVNAYVRDGARRRGTHETVTTVKTAQGTEHEDSRSNSTASRMEHQTLAIKFGVGAHFDNGQIKYDKAQHAYDYSGPSVDGAAVAADAAHQIW